MLTPDYTKDPNLALFSRRGFSGIAYSDGDEAEQRMLEVVRAAADRSVFSEEIARGITDWPSEYHFSRQRHCLLRPLGIRPGDKVLEVGCGCGALTRFLGETGADVTAIEGSLRRACIAAERCRDLPNVRIIAEDLTQVAMPDAFDWILLVGVLEYAPVFLAAENPALQFLQTVSRWLKPDGRLVVAIENKLGLKYFNGCGEDHIGIPFSGVQNLYQPGQPRTFGRKELELLLKSAGLPFTEFWYPFPDYKLPDVILSHGALSDPDFRSAEMLARTYSRDYSGRSERLFIEPLVARELERNGLLGDFSNSFLVVASRQTPTSTCGTFALSFAAGRRPEYAVETRIARSNGSILVVKRPLRSTSATAPPASPPRVFRQRLESAPYVAGSLALWKLTEQRALRHGKDQAVEALAPWFDYLLERASKTSSTEANSLADYWLDGRYLDCTPYNLVDSGGVLSFIDQEWEFEGRIELGWVVTRSVAITLVTNPGLESSPIKLADVVGSLCARHAITVDDTDIRRWLVVERKFREAVFGPSVLELDSESDLDPVMFSRRMTGLFDEIDELKSKARQLDHANAEREAAIREAELDHQRLTQNLTAARKDADNNAKQLSTLTAALTEADSDVKRLSALAVEKDTLLRNATEELKALRRSLSERESEVAARTDALAQAEQRVGEASVALAACAEETGRLRVMLAESQNRSQAYVQSTSWKVTAPLRATKSVPRHVRQTIHSIRAAVHVGGGFQPTLRKAVKAYRNEGVSGIVWRYRYAKALVPNQITAFGASDGPVPAPPPAVSPMPQPSSLGGPNPPPPDSAQNDLAIPLAEIKRSILYQQKPLADRVAAWTRPLPRRTLTEVKLLRQLSLAAIDAKRGVVISVSHDDYRNIAGGIQLCVQLEQSEFVRTNYLYLGLQPASPLPVLSQIIDPEKYVFHLVIDGQSIGAVTAATLGETLARAIQRGDRASCVVHSLLGQSPEVIEWLLERLRVSNPLFWVHDYSGACPNHNLVRNDVTYCGAPPTQSLSCRICCYGAERVDHTRRLSQLFTRVTFDIVAPSQFALDLWLRSTSLPHGKTCVIPHTHEGSERTLPLEPAADAHHPVRIAFLGHPALHKGWPVFLQLVNIFSHDKRYEFHHLGQDSTRTKGISFTSVRTSSAARDAMTRALVQERIDVALIWPTWPETYSFTFHESLAAGALVLTNPGSGNIHATIAAGTQGLVLPNERELVALLSGDELVQRISRRRLRGRMMHETEFSRMSADVIIPVAVSAGT